MNKTVIALIAVSLGALLPVPSAQALKPIGVCMSEPSSFMEGAAAPELEVDLTDGGHGEACLGEVATPRIPLQADRMQDTLPVGGTHHPCDVDGYSEDDPWFGGTHVTCYYSCHAVEALAINVRAEDQDAEVDGYTDCGNAHAICPRTPVFCYGNSDGLTEFDDSDQGCVGNSRETRSSRVTVNCFAIGRSVLCRMTGYTCETETRSSVTQACLQQNPSAAVEPLMRLIAGLADLSDIGSFVAFEFETVDSIPEGFVVQYDATGPEPSCWAGPL